jgi:hypothetical protein
VILAGPNNNPELPAKSHYLNTRNQATTISIACRNRIAGGLVYFNFQEEEPEEE